MNVIIAPTSDDTKPCDGRSELFESPNHADHLQARVHCRGSKKLGVPGCPFIGWCKGEREAFQASDYRGGLHGTWHGVLFVDGKASPKGTGKPGRPRKNEAAA